MANAFNIGRFEAQRQSSDDPLVKAAEFDLVDAAGVLDRMFPPSVKTAAAIHHATAVSPMYSRPPDFLKRRKKTARPEVDIRMVDKPPDRELDVATRPIARTHRKIFGDFRCALALALLRNDLQRRDRVSGRSFRCFRGGSLPSSLTITNVLRPPTLTARIARTIPETRLPPSPSRRRPHTRLAAILRLRTQRHKPPLAPLQQAQTEPTATRRLWPIRSRTLK